MQRRWKPRRTVFVAAMVLWVAMGAVYAQTQTTAGAAESKAQATTSQPPATAPQPRSFAPPPGALIAPGASPHLILLYTGNVIGYIDPCG